MPGPKEGILRGTLDLSRRPMSELFVRPDRR
jgi:hypothetical protein